MSTISNIHRISLSLEYYFKCVNNTFPFQHHSLPPAPPKITEIIPLCLHPKPKKTTEILLFLWFFWPPSWGTYSTIAPHSYTRWSCTRPWMHQTNQRSIQPVACGNLWRWMMVWSMGQSNLWWEVCVQCDVWLWRTLSHPAPRIFSSTKLKK